jgi:outer membrane receptor for ferrienterochelin and colicins
LLLLVLVLCMAKGFGQNVFKAVIQDGISNEVLSAASARLKGVTAVFHADSSGMILIQNIPNGSQVLVFSMDGYHTLEKTFVFPLSESPVLIYLVPVMDEIEEVIIVEGTRSNRSIANIPTRVEVLTEEIDEASTMDPSKIAHLITHSTGIQVQQTSATSNTANVRIQGLDGRYTQILKDGFPLYGGFSGSLSIMQIPPLDLRQVEYIKGGASTLYGGGAISGLINLISKEPEKEETLLHVNASHIGAFDVNAFISKKEGKVGFTLLGQRNSQRYFDADKDGFTDMPELTKYNLHPKLFFYINDKNKLSVGGTFTTETRQGGDVQLLGNEYADSNHFYRERNDVNRITTQLKFEHRLSKNSNVTVRNSFNIFRRSLEITPSAALDNYRFAGRQLSSFSEVAYKLYLGQNVLITGINAYSDDFWEDSLQSPVLRDEASRTLGAFANYTFDIGKKVSLETGLRGDYVLDQKFMLLPRISALFQWTKKLSTRIGGGMGYRGPTIFNQEAELLGYRNVLAIDRSNTRAEQSFGSNVDIGFKSKIGENFSVQFNQMLFFTYLKDPLVLVDTGSNSGVYHFANTNGHTQSLGAETFFKLGFYDFVLFVGYTYTNATNHFNGSVSDLTLTPHHSLKGDLLYAIPGKWRIGLDYEFKSQQTLSTGRKTPAFWTYGAVVEYTKNKFTFFGNVENYTNVRQTNYESLISGPNNTPQFTEVWAPLDGIVFNAGIKIRL